VTHTDRLRADATGQLGNELRSRIQSGIQIEHLEALASLLTDIGPPCWATHDTAAAIAPFDEFRLRPPFHVLIPRGRNVRRIGHVIHTSDTIPPIDRETKFGIPVIAPTRALLQVAATTDAERLTAAFDGALRDRLTTEDFVHRRIADLRTSGRYGIPRLLSVIEGSEITRGGQSWLERRFLELFHAARLPRPTTQAHLGVRKNTLIRVDFRFEGTPVVVEALGYRWHRTGAQMRIDSDRMNRLVLDGYLVLQFTYGRLMDDPDGIVAEVLEALGPYTIPRSA
jgi:very-short-patch-repair endonuclease